MVVKHDKDILRSLAPDSHTFICFRPGEDVFIMLAYSEPPNSFYARKAPGVFHALAMVYYTRYQEGLVDEFKSTLGEWLKKSADDPTPVFSAEGKENKGVSAVVDGSEIGFDFSYKNTKGNNVIYSYQIRRSTLRFLESFAWEETPATQKTAKEPAQPATQGTSSNSGYCAEFTPTPVE